MGFFGRKSRDKSEDECLAYIRQAKREAERKADGMIVYKCVACGKEFKRNTKQHTRRTGHETFQLVKRKR